MRNITILILISQLSYGGSFESDCLECHQNNNQLQVFLHRYTLKYSSEAKIKEALTHYLKEPKAQNSIMPWGFINRWGVKEKTTLNDTQLKEAIEEYYKRYNLKRVWQP
jgi:hypothetical protein